MTFRSSFALSAVLACTGMATAQNRVAPATPATQAAAPPAMGATALLQPSLTELGQTLGMIRLERWKAPNATRDEEQANLVSIRRDLDETLPGLLAANDAAPQSLTAMLPVSRNLTALYDVLLRVTERAKVSAPAEQVSALEHVRLDLDSARRSFEESMQTAASTQEAQIRQMKAALAAPPPPAPVAPPPPTPTPKKKTRPKPKPATPS